MNAELEARLNKTLSDYAVTDQHVTRQRKQEHRVIPGVHVLENYREVRVVSVEKAQALAIALSETARDRGFNTEISTVRDAVVLDISRLFVRFQRIAFYVPFGTNKSVTPKNGVAGPKRYQAAIVIDDVGYDRKPLAQFIALGIPLTFAVLPTAPHAVSIAQEIHAHHYAVMVHLPLQPSDLKNNPPAADTLLLTMGKDEIIRRVDQQLAKLPFAVGVNNHQGSAFTENGERMHWVLSRIKSRRLYFLDSHTSANSVGPQVARQLAVPVRSNDTFLDNEDSVVGIERQLDVMMAQALKRGDTVAIGHYRRKHIIEALTNKLPEFQKKGIELVSLSALYP